MKDREKRLAEVEHIYSRESLLLEKVREIQSDNSITREFLLEQFIQLSNEYNKLLRQTMKITRIGDNNQRKLFLANEQINKQKEELSIAYKKMELLARTDPLTQISNRRDFLEKFHHEIIRFERNPVPFSIVLGDIDDFKSINDRFGHDCGDFVLVQIANIIKATIRKQDTVGRWGGEEFILLLPQSPLKGGETVADSIRKHIASENFCFNDHRFSLSITFGVCEFSRGMDIDSCIKNADIALYIGKRNGKNCVVPAIPKNKNAKKI